MKQLKVILELSHKEADILKTALQDLHILLSDDPDWPKGHKISDKECQQVMHKLNMAEVKFVEREWRNKDES